MPDQAGVALEWYGAALDQAGFEAEGSSGDQALARMAAGRGVDTVVTGRVDKLPEPHSPRQLLDRMAAARPGVDLSEPPLEASTWTGFAESFVDQPGHRPRLPDLTPSVAAVPLADACNIGLAAVSNPGQRALTAARLAWVRMHFIYTRAIVEANARLVGAQARLPLARQPAVTSPWRKDGASW